MGGYETGTPVLVEPTLKYHPDSFGVLTQARYPGRGQCMVGSLTGVVSSQRVTEEHEGALSVVARLRGIILEIPPFCYLEPNPARGTVLGG